MFDPPVVSADSHWALWALLLAAAWLGIRLERTRLGGRISGAVISILTTFVLSNLGIIPADAPAYGVVWSYLVPLAIPLLLLRANLKRILRESGPTLVAFALGAAGSVLGTLLAFWIVPLGPEGHKLAGIFCATYIGGSLNYVATANALGLRSGDLLTAGVAADNLMMTVYFLILFALPSMAALKRHYRQRVPEGKPTAEAQAGSARAATGLTLEKASAGLALAGVACALGKAVEQWTGLEGTAILTLTTLVVVVATAAPRAMARLDGAEQLGTLLMQVFFAAIGASANLAVVLRYGPVLFLFAALILAVHLTVVLLAGWLLRLDLAELVIASNANMGGPTTAAAMAVARRWETLVIPAVLCGTLGYAIATFIGVAVGHLLQ
ncbi:MAG: DUF819 family protein [Myxococcota bacterium]|nr:DUF819 family protein [Myxococcota bacterium]